MLLVPLQQLFALDIKGAYASLSIQRAQYEGIALTDPYATTNRLIESLEFLEQRSRLKHRKLVSSCVCVLVRQLGCQVKGKTLPR